MKFNKILFLSLLTGMFLSFSSLSIADVNETEISAIESSSTETYGTKVGQKVLRGLSNATLGFFEIPKNMILVTNKSNLLYGLTGGVSLGVLNTIGRTAVGISDLVFFLLPTKPVARPVHPWDSYLEVETSYDDIFDLDF